MRDLPTAISPYRNSKGEFLPSPLCAASTITLLGCTIFQFMVFRSILMVVLLAHVEDIDYLLFQ